MSSPINRHAPAQTTNRTRTRQQAAPTERPQGDTFQRQQVDQDAANQARLRSMRFTAVPRIDENYERALLGGQNQPGRLVQLAEGGRRAGTTVTIHGINGNPTDVQSLSERAAGQGHNVHTFVYDDQRRRLTDSSADLAGQLGDWMRENPGQPLRIQAHSMGSRVALGALSRLQEEGRLTNPVQLDMIAPPLGGFGSANAARLDVTGVMGGMINGLRPGRDMGTTSGFQQDLEALRLPPSVQTRIFTGAEDTLVDPNMPGFRVIAENLGARQRQLPGDHSGVVEQVARLGR